MQLLSKINKKIRFFKNIFTLVINLKAKKCIAITDCKTWEDWCIESYDRSMKSWLLYKHIEIFWTHNKGKSFVAETLLEV